MDVVVRQPVRRSYWSERVSSAGPQRSSALTKKYGERGSEVFAPAENRATLEAWLASRGRDPKGYKR